MGFKAYFYGLSDNSAKYIVDLFRTVSRWQGCIEDTVGQILKNRVIDFVWFVVSFDESLNEAKQTSEMDICLRFWNKENNQVEESYWDSKCLEKTNHEHILNCVHEDLKVFDMAKMIQLLMDGPM